MTYFDSVIFSFSFKPIIKRPCLILSCPLNHIYWKHKKGEIKVLSIWELLLAPVFCGHVLVTKLKKKKPEQSSVQHRDLRSSSTACNVLKKLYSALAPAQHVLHSTTSRFLSQWIKPWFFCPLSKTKAPGKIEGGKKKAFQAVDRQSRKVCKKHTYARNDSSPVKLKWIFLTFVCIHLLFFPPILTSKPFWLWPGLAGLLLGGEKKEIKIHQRMCHLVMK